MAICEHTPPPCPPRGVDTAVWATEIDRRRNIIGLLASRGSDDGSRLSASLWLCPDEAEKVGKALIDAAAAWRAAQ